MLLNASLADISDKLCFKTVHEVEDTGKVLYAEETLKGISIVQENTEGEDSKVNLEQLFNAVTEKPEMVKAIFSNNEY